MQRTLVIAKPDAVERGLAGTILARREYQPRQAPFRTKGGVREVKRAVYAGEEQQSNLCAIRTSNL